MGTVASPIYSITYNGKDISKTLAPYLNILVFEDTVEGESSSLEIECENVDRLFSNGWYPEKGATLTASIGRMQCGTFTMDEIELSGPPHVIRMKALTNIVTKKALKTKRSKAHEGMTLLQIAHKTAAANGLTVFGTIPDITIERVSQRRSTDLKFLRKVSWDYGIVFKVRDKQLVFTYLPDLDKRPAALSLDITDLTNYKITDKTDKTYKATKVRSHNPKTRKTIVGNANITTLSNNDGVDYTQVTAADTQVVHKKVENQQQADAMANAYAYRANSWQQSGTIDAPGNEAAIAGNNTELCGLGAAGSGVYNLTKVTHTVDRANSWVFSGTVKRVGTVSAIKQRGKKIVQPTINNSITTLSNKDGVTFTQIGATGN